jgi:hypothetical protein
MGRLSQINIYLIILETSHPSIARKLCPAAASIVETDIGVKVVRNLPLSIWDAVDETGSQMLWLASQLVQVY